MQKKCQNIFKELDGSQEKNVRHSDAPIIDHVNYLRNSNPDVILFTYLENVSPRTYLSEAKRILVDGVGKKQSESLKVDAKM